MRNIIGKMWNRFRGHSRSERGENTITMLIAFPLLWAVIMTIIDFGVFINNTSTLREDLRDGARIAAVFGGTDNDISAAYGTSCTSTSSEGGSKGGRTDSNNIVSCLVANKINENTSYVNNMIISDIKCGPSSGTKVGQATWCSAHYLYEGMPGSVFSLFGGGVQSFNDAGGTVATSSGDSSGWNVGTMKVSAQSEVSTR
jgi:Flp pilus assembly protein TadG